MNTDDLNNIIGLGLTIGVASMAFRAMGGMFSNVKEKASSKSNWFKW